MLLLAGLGGQIGHDEIEFQRRVQVLQAVGQLRAGIADAVGGAVAVRVLHRHEVLVDHHRLPLGRQPRQRHADGAVAAADVQAIGILRNLHVLQQQPGAVIDGFRRKDAPGGVKGQGLPEQGVLEADVLAPAREGVFVGSGHEDLAGRYRR